MFASSSLASALFMPASLTSFGPVTPVAQRSTNTQNTKPQSTRSSALVGECRNVYALVEGKQNGYGSYIHRLDVDSNRYSQSKISLPNGVTSATLALSEDGKFFTVADGPDAYLHVYDSKLQKWVKGAKFAGFTESGVGVINRMIRMTVAQDGTGYVMDAQSNMWSFKTSTPYNTKYEGLVRPSNTSKQGFSQNGDMFASADGKIYILSSKDSVGAQKLKLDLWAIDPKKSTVAEYLGNVDDKSIMTDRVRYGGFAVSEKGIFGSNSAGKLIKIDLKNLKFDEVASKANPGTTDLASCYFADLKPKMSIKKSVRNVTTNSALEDEIVEARPGDIVEYVIDVRNAGTLAAGGVVFRDPLPEHLSYVADSAKINGFNKTILNGEDINLAGKVYPFKKGVGICSKKDYACDSQVLNIDTTANKYDQEARITFRAVVNDNYAGKIKNTASTRHKGDPDNKWLSDDAFINVKVEPIGNVQCNRLYGLGTIPAVQLGDEIDYPRFPGKEVYGAFIQQINTSSNTFEGTKVLLPRINGKQSTSATLAVTPTGDKFFVVTDDTRLRVYDTKTGFWSEGGKFSELPTDITQNRMIRMGIAPDGTGYAMDSKERRIWSFQTKAPYTVKSLGIVKTQGIASDKLFNGDLFAASDGKLYMLSSSDEAQAMHLWVMNPKTNVLVAEYAGKLRDTSSQKPQFGGFAALPDAVYGSDGAGRLTTIDLFGRKFEFIGGSNGGTTDLTSCYYPDYTPKIKVLKSVKNLSRDDSEPAHPGDILRFTIKVRNIGNVFAGGTVFRDALPEGVTYVENSAKINGFDQTVLNGNTISLKGKQYPFGKNVGICSKSNPAAACKDQVLRFDNKATPNSIEGEAEIVFDVKIDNPFLNANSKVINQAFVGYTDGPDTPSNKVEKPVKKPASVKVFKTVQNISQGGPVTTLNKGNVGDILEYCITHTNTGSAKLFNMLFEDKSPVHVNVLADAYGSNRAIRVKTAKDEIFYDLSATNIPQNPAPSYRGGGLRNGKITVYMGDFVLESQQKFSVCFRGQIK